MKSAILSVVRSATDLVFPPRCVHCGADGSLFCPRCEASSTRLQIREVCRKCALPAVTTTCEACFLEPPALDRVVAVFTYEPAVRDAVSALKYRDIRALAPRLGELIAQALPPGLADATDALVPVPLSAGKLRSRGYNQSELLARKIAADTAIKLWPGLVTRTHEAGPQARSVDLESRRRNVENAFRASEDARGKRLLLVDDVMTSGATLNACAAALKAAGASKVGALVLAREL